MAAAAGSTNIFRDGRLQYGGLNVRLPETTRFWARTDEEHETTIELNVPTKDCHMATFALVFATSRAYEDAIRGLFENGIKASRMFAVERIKIIEPKDGQPDAIALKMSNPLDVRNFITHGKEIFFEQDFEVRGDDDQVTLRVLNYSRVDANVDKVNHLFQTIIARMGDGNITIALENLRDERFPPMQRERGGAMSAIESSDFHRTYELTEDGAQEVMQLVTKRKETVSAEKIMAWLKDPKSFEGEHVAKYLQFVFSEIERSPLDLPKIQKFIPEYLLKDDRFSDAYKSLLTVAISNAWNEGPVDGDKLVGLMGEAQRMKMDIGKLRPTSQSS